MDNAFKLTAKNFELELDEDSKDYKHPPIIEFTCTLNNKFLFNFLPEQGSIGWKMLAYACLNNTKDGIDWSPCNGESSMRVTTLGVEFTIAKYGDGRGGSLTIIIPAKDCYDAFIEADKITEKWMNETKLISESLNN